MKAPLLGSVYTKFLFAFAIVGFVACESTTKNQENISEEPQVVAQEISDTTHVYLLANVSTSNREVWRTEVEKVLSRNEGVNVEGFYFNMIDTSLVYALLKCSSKDLAESANSELEILTQGTGFNSTYMFGMKDVDLSAGFGDAFLVVSHAVKDFDTWYNAFSSMDPVKKNDSIYVLGVFTDINRPPAYVSVIAQAASLVKASRYGDELQKSHLMEAAGVTDEPEALVLRPWSYKKK